MESGKSEEESNMAMLTPVIKNMDQNQNEGAKKESNVLATREAKESIVQLGWATHMGDSNTENTITQSKHEERANENSKNSLCGTWEKVKKEAKWTHRGRSEKALIRTRTLEKREYRTFLATREAKEVIAQSTCDKV